MLASTTITRCRRKLTETSAAFWSDAELLDLGNEAEMDINQQAQLLELKASTACISGQREYPMPSNFLSVHAVFLNTPSSDGTDSWTRLEPTVLEKEGQEHPNFLSSDPTTFDFPRKYWIWNNTLFLDPVPATTSAVDNLVIFFRSRTTDLTTTAQSWNLDDECEQARKSFILWKAWEKSQELTLAAKEQGNYLMEIRKIRAWRNKILADNRRKFDVESSVPFSPSGSMTSGFNPF